MSKLRICMIHGFQLTGTCSNIFANSHYVLLFIPRLDKELLFLYR